MRPEDVIIVGAGPAGCAAAAQCRRLGLAPLLLERTGRAGGLVANAFCVENYPGLPPTPGPRMGELLAEHLRRFAVAVVRRTVVSVAPDADALCLATDDGDLRARCVILAPGTRPLPLALPGADSLAGRGLFYEVRDLLASVPRPRRVVIVGSGEAALDYALTLAGAGARVTLVVRGREPRARGRLLSMVQSAPEIDWLFGAQPVALTERNEHRILTCTVAGSEHTLPGDAVLAAVGRQSALGNLPGDLLGDLLGSLPGDPLGDWGRQFGARVRTSVPGLFLAGDARWGALGQCAMAAGDGLAAAMMAARILGERDGDA